MIMIQAVLTLPLVQAHCHECVLADCGLQGELSLVQMKSQVLRRSSGTGWAQAANRSQAVRAGEYDSAELARENQTFSGQLTLLRALGQSAREQGLLGVKVPSPTPGAARGLPAVLETAASMVDGPPAGAASAEMSDNALGIVVILLVVVFVVACLLYLVLTHEPKVSNDRGLLDRPRLSSGRALEGSARLVPGRGPAGSARSSLPYPPLVSAGRAHEVPSSHPGSKPKLPMGSQSSLALEDPTQLPMIYPDLVMSSARTRLAVPVEPLMEPEFEIDVLGVSGVPLLTATLNSRGGRRVVQLALHSVGTLLARVTSEMQLLRADGAHFGTLTKDDVKQQYILREPGGRVILNITPGGNSHEVQMVSTHAGKTIDRATVVRRPAGRLPAEHYEVSVGPQVDAVLVLACFLGLEAFAVPQTPEATKTGMLFG
mmetsp:Transcript_59099/g.183490  ORF Transcript_59099/g.183490 Transcript_59099/m.183490 type:complete len:430 (-) Transcript_59099:205-1494(-)|eukprot:CAMPEP_0204604058 /NCGR_PEP_ID=MMETSP0661-20131031/57625_1 /ASSEMBLY_ACC=CAM_ASM_000606 /TAXON_ID=109239 /ORGANISM="Alexandrium margalefi, Strain AMGDE01CS-322" /LENGTH=429 /DNA_ID=CAMNT_0051615181 /DNA_START=116 /DNA_END=1405 /DNA_ORIENTATION=+